MPPFFMKKILGHDEETGLTEIFHHDEVNNVSTIETVQDVQPIMENTKRLANDSTYTRSGMKQDWLHYAHIPDSIILKLREEHGLNVFNPDHTKAVFRKINELYPNFKVTNMRHAPRG
jgi:hypothetical protein